MAWEFWSAEFPERSWEWMLTSRAQELQSIQQLAKCQVQRPSHIILHTYVQLFSSFNFFKPGKWLTYFSEALLQLLQWHLHPESQQRITASQEASGPSVAAKAPHVDQSVQIFHLTVLQCLTMFYNVLHAKFKITLIWSNLDSLPFYWEYSSWKATKKRPCLGQVLDHFHIWLLTGRGRDDPLEAHSMEPCHTGSWVATFAQNRSCSLGAQRLQSLLQVAYRQSWRRRQSYAWDRSTLNTQNTGNLERG